MKTASLLSLLLVCPALSGQEDIIVEVSSDEAQVASDSATEASPENEWKPEFRVQLLLTPDGNPTSKMVHEMMTVTKLIPKDLEDQRRDGQSVLGVVYSKSYEQQRVEKRVLTPGSLEIHCDSVSVSMASSEDEDTVSLEVAGKARISLPGFATIECSSAKLSGGKLVLKEAKTLGAVFKFSASELTLDVEPVGVKTTRFGQEGDQMKSADTPSPVPDAAFEAAQKPREVNRRPFDGDLRRSDYRSFPPAKPEQ